MSVFDKLHDFFSAIGRGIAHLFSKSSLDKADQIAKRVSGIGAVILPYALQIARFTPTDLDDKLVAAAAELNTTVADIVAIPDHDAKKVAVENLLVATGRKALAELVALHGAFKLGDLTIADENGISQIARGWFELAAKGVYEMFIKPSLEANK